MSSSNRTFLGLLGLLSAHTSITSPSAFAKYLKLLSSQEIQLLLESASLLVSTHSHKKDVVWMFNNPKYELELLVAALLPINKRDVDVSKATFEKFEAFNQILEFLEIHKDTFPFIDIQTEIYENPYPTKALEDPSTNVTQAVPSSVDEEGRMSTVSALIIPSVVIGATVLLALNKK